MNRSEPGGKVISACEVASDVTVTKKVLENREVIVLVKNFEIVTSNFVR